MSTEFLSTKVHSATVGVPGRSINQARDQHFVIDSPTIGSALASGEAFLAGVSSCGVTLVERAAQGSLGLGEIAGLFWHLVHERPAGLTREDVGEAVVAGGLARATPVLRVVLGQILQGRA